MKKFLSLFCALVIALSVSAVPQFQVKKVASFAKAEKVEKKAKMTGVKLQKVDFTKFAEPKKVATGIKRARKAKAAATIDVSKVRSNYYEQYSDVYYVLYDETGENIFTFDIILPEGEEDVTAGKTYTLQDMDEDYCQWGDPTWVNYGYGASYNSASFKKTLNAQGKIKIEASVVDEDEEEYSLVFDESLFPELPAGGSFVADKVVSEFYEAEDEGDPNDIYYTLSVSSIGAEFYFDIYVADGDKDVKSGQTYTLTNMYLDYCSLETAARVIAYKSASFTKTVAADGSYTITIVAVDENNNTWNLSASKAAPTILTQTLTLDGIAEAGSSMSQIEAANADSTILVSLLLYSDNLVGDFTEDDLYTLWSLSYVLYEGVEYDIEEASFSVTYDDATGKYAANGTLSCVDPDDDLNKAVFTIALTLSGDEPADPVDPIEGGVTNVTFEMQDMEVTLTSDYWQLAGNDPTATYHLCIRSKSATVDGNYTEATLDDYYTYIGIEGPVFYDINEANITASMVEDVLSAKGTITFINADKNDTIIATIDVAGSYSSTIMYEEASNYDQVFNGYTIDEQYLEKYGSIYIEGVNDAGYQIILDMTLPEGAKALTAGVYNIDNSYDPQTVYSGIYDDEEGFIPSFAYTTIEQDGKMYFDKIWWIVSGTVTVDENLNITVDAMNSADYKVQAVLYAPQEEEAIVNANATIKAAKRLVKGQLVIEKNGIQYNAQGAMIK